MSNFCLQWWVDNYICAHCVGVRRRDSLTLPSLRRCYYCSFGLQITDLAQLMSLVFAEVCPVHAVGDFT